MRSKPFYGGMLSRILPSLVGGCVLLAAEAAAAREGTPQCDADTARLVIGEQAPYMSRHLPGYGFMSAVTTAAFNASGVKVEWGFFPWRRAYRYAQIGLRDGSVGWVWTEDRGGDFLYSQPLVEDTDYVYSKASAPVDWHQLSDLNGHTFILEHATVYPLLDAAIAEGRVEVKYNKFYANLLPMVLGGRANATILTKLQAEYMIRQNSAWTQQIYRAKKPMFHRVYHVILSKQSERAVCLRSKLNAGLKAIHSNGIYRDLRRKLDSGYFDTPREK